VPVFLIETRCAAAVALERLARREAQGRDPSDAGPAFYAQSVARYQPPADWPAEALRIVETDRDGWRGALRAIAAELPRRVD